MSGNQMLDVESQQITNKFALFNLGFRPFFIGAVLFAVLSMLYWMLIYVFNFHIHLKTLSPMSWHAHEMVFGYSMAVIAGFLLTAVNNWTGIRTLSGSSLLFLFLTWMAARLLAFTEDTFPFELMAIIDCLFMILLICSISYPIIKARQWKQLGIVAKLVLLLASNILFYLGALKIMPEGERLGLYSGFYIIISLILVLGRRVIPFFIERGVDNSVQLHNWKWLDISSLVLFVAFWIADVFLNNGMLTTILAGMLFILYGIRMIGWYTKDLWKKPLLWVIYVAYGWIVLGFGLKVAAFAFGISPYLSIHAFAVGGIGMMTIGMMARVSLGHTGRNVSKAPSILFWVFTVLLLGTIIRVIFPLLDQGHYILWMGLSQMLWVISFLVFLILYIPILISPRIDGKFG